MKYTENRAICSKSLFGYVNTSLVNTEKKEGDKERITVCLPFFAIVFALVFLIESSQFTSSSSLTYCHGWDLL